MSDRWPAVLRAVCAQQRDYFIEAIRDISGINRSDQVSASSKDTIAWDLSLRAELAEAEVARLRSALQKIIETTDDGCVEELAERALALPQAHSKTNTDLA